MTTHKLKSYAKINLSLSVLGKLKSNFHRIESIVSFINLYDEIEISKINHNFHKIYFYGRFSKNIPKINTVSKLLNVLDKKNLLKKKKYLIKIKKNIPLKSGLGGGSMNASTILNYFINRNKINKNSKTISEIANNVGSDVILGLEKKNTILMGNGKIIRIKTKFKLHTLIIKPNFGCSTKDIYKGIDNFSKKILDKKKIKNLSINKLISFKNDLEKIAFKKYPKLQNIKKTMLSLSNVRFVRMTGSGSCIVAFFHSKKTSLNGAKILKNKYKNYWCILSKTI